MGILPIILIEEDATLMRNNLGSIIQKKKERKSGVMTDAYNSQHLRQWDLP